MRQLTLGSPARCAVILSLLATPVPAETVQVVRPAYPTTIMVRAASLFDQRDLSGARRLYEAAARDGVAEAATALGRSYDPGEIARMRSTITPDRLQAERWYRRAIDLGDPTAQPLLDALSDNH